MLRARTLIGPHLVVDGPGAVLEIPAPENARERAAAGARNAALAEHVRALGEALGLPRVRPVVRRHARGLQLGTRAPLDALGTAAALLEEAWRLAGGDGRAPPFDACVERLRARRDAEARPALRALESAAAGRRVPLLVDRARVTLGYGARAQGWPLDALPDRKDVDWDALAAPPVALLAGGPVAHDAARRLARVLRAAGHVTALLADGAPRVDDAALPARDATAADPDDRAHAAHRADAARTDPRVAAARALLRDPRVEAAVLVLPLDALLAHGLAVPVAGAAAVLGDVADRALAGLDTPADRADALLLVAHAVPPDGRLVLDADDPAVWERGARRSLPSLPAARTPRAEGLAACLSLGRDALWCDDGRLHARWRGDPLALPALDALPPASSGAPADAALAALGAAGLALALGAPPDALARGLTA